MNFRQRFSIKTLKYQIFMKIRPMETEFFHADGLAGGRTERYDKADSSFSLFYERA
jgi:hypothetical protein